MAQGGKPRPTKLPPKQPRSATAPTRTHEAAARRDAGGGSEPPAGAERARDRFWLLGILAAAAILFGSTYATTVDLGDAPESVSGIHELGIVHAPGYPAYVLLARAFGTLVPIGGWAARANLFSLVCSTLTVGVLFLLARRFGASRAGSAIGAFAVAASASFWFNASFAKHYPLTGLSIAVAVWAAAGWQEDGGRWRLVATGLALGLAAGSSWQTAGIMGVGLAVWFALGSRRLGARDLVAVVGPLVAVTVVLWSWVWIRAGQDPTVNWGDASSLDRFLRLLNGTDFRGAGTPDTGLGALDDAPWRTWMYGVFLNRDLGLATLLVAGVGGAVAALRCGRARVAFLATIVVVNVAAVVFFAVGLNTTLGISSAMVNMGFFLGLYVVGAVLVALGTTGLCDLALHWSPDGGTGRARRRTATSRSPWIGVAVASLVAVVVLVPSLLVHHRYAEHGDPPLADNYANRVLSPLPPDATFVSWHNEMNQALLYRQIVHGDRPDVTLVSATMMDLPWYREQLRARLGEWTPDPDTEFVEYVNAFVAASRERGPVFAEARMPAQLRGQFPMRPLGLTVEVTDDTEVDAATLDRAARELRTGEEADGVSRDDYRFPNRIFFTTYYRAHVELAKQYAALGDAEGAAEELRRAIEVMPAYNQGAVLGLQAIEAGDPNALAFLQQL